MHVAVTRMIDHNADRGIAKASRAESPLARGCYRFRVHTGVERLRHAQNVWDAIAVDEGVKHHGALNTQAQRGVRVSRFGVTEEDRGAHATADAIHAAAKPPADSGAQA